MRALACLLVAGLATPVAADRTYEGREAAALRCANTVALTAVTMGRAGMIGDDQKGAMLGISLLMLERHVSGTWTEKKRALEIVRDRRSVEDTLEDYRRNAARCLRDFPIN